MFGRKDHSRDERASGPSSSHAPPIPDYLPPQLEMKPDKVTIHINGESYRVSRTQTILEACGEHGIHVPTLCHHPALPPTGRCGVCTVHIEGRNPPFRQACKTHVERGMRITTNSPEVLYQAQMNLREFLGTHALRELNATPEIEDLVRFVEKGTLVSQEQHSHQYAITRSQEQCISCTRCVRACSGIQNMNILNIDPDRPLQPISFEGDRPLHATDCIACGQCVAVCPTGAVSERDDVPLVLAELQRVGAARRVLVVQTAPAARLSVGELFGDAPAHSPAKTVAALHALGFDYVFDTTFGADLTAHFEARELAERLRARGPWPMFTSCCPGWLILLEKRYPHLLPLVSRCRSPMMMLAAAVRAWMAHRGVPRDRYYSVALMPCTAKKEEIARADLRAPDGRPDVDVVLTARELGRLLAQAHVDWAALPGPHRTAYDAPFAASSGAAALFPVAGGVTEAALREAYTLYTHQLPRDPARTLYAQVRRQPPSPGEWVAAEVPVTPDHKHKRPIETLVVSGTRAIQQYLEDAGLDTPAGLAGAAGAGAGPRASVFVESMACPGGCINGGGQPHSLNPNIVAIRRRAVHDIDHSAPLISATAAQQSLDTREVFGVDSIDSLRPLMECPPRLPPHKQHRNHKHHNSHSHSHSRHRHHDKPQKPSGDGDGVDDDDSHSRSSNNSSTLSHSGSMSGTSSSSSSSSASVSSSSSSASSSTTTSRDGRRKKGVSTSQASAASFLGSTCVLYGSQSGFTASFAKQLYSMLERSVPDSVSIHSMDHVDFAQLSSVDTLVVLTSTWESDYGLMPENAVKFFGWLTSLPVSSFGSLLRGTKFAVCGFGSTRYREYCGFAIQLHRMFVRLGAYPFLDLLKIDVDRSDRGKRAFLRWAKEVVKTLQTVALPPPRYLLVPSISHGGRAAPLTTPLNYSVATVTRLKSYRKVIAGGENYFYLELDTGHVVVEPAPDQYVYVLPCNPRSDVESLVNTLYPGMLNTPITVLPATHVKESTTLTDWLPPHLTVRQLFERYIDLSQRPARWFVKQMETLNEDITASGTAKSSSGGGGGSASSSTTMMMLGGGGGGGGGGAASGNSGNNGSSCGGGSSTLRELVDDPQAFAHWSVDKTYFAVLREYKDVIPPIEVLITMLPLMQPRCYTPIHQDTPAPNTLSFMFKRIDGGLCTNYLAGLRKGDPVVWLMGKSEFRRPNDEILRPFFDRHAHGHSRKQLLPGPQGLLVSTATGSGIGPAVPASETTPTSPLSSAEGSGSGSTDSSHTTSSSSSGTGSEGHHTHHHTHHHHQTTTMPPPATGPLDAPEPGPECPLTVSTTVLFTQLARKPGVDETVSEAFDVSNRSREKVRFTLLAQETVKYRLAFEPATGIVKPHFTVRVTATLTTFCTCKVRVRVPLAYETLGRRAGLLLGDGGGGGGGSGSVATVALVALVDTKISPKLDYDELRFVRVIGHGTYGTVSLGEWRGQDVAIKVIKTGHMNDESFERECALLQEIRCQYVLNFIGYCVLADKRCLVTEYLGLGSLANYIHSPLTPEYRLKVALDTAKGMAFLHHCGLMHRDLKPENLLVSSLDPAQQVVVKIADFGASKELTPLKKQTTGVGTPIYMAPEVLEGSQYSTSADVYSFAVLLLELYTAAEPYATDAFPAPWHIARFVTQGHRLPVPATVPPPIAALIEHGWRQHPAERPTFDDIAEALARIAATGTADTAGTAGNAGTAALEDSDDGDGDGDLPQLLPTRVRRLSLSDSDDLCPASAASAASSVASALPDEPPLLPSFDNSDFALHLPANRLSSDGL